MVVLWILGESKSGKSELAEAIFFSLPGEKFYIGTLPRIDKWIETIRKHAERRPKEWKLIEVKDSLNIAINIIKKYKGKDKKVAVLLDGWGVFVKQCTSNKDIVTKGIMNKIYEEYHQLTRISDYLIVVAHVSAYPSKSLKYDHTNIVKNITGRCIANADKIIYHDLEDVSHKDKEYVKSVSEEMITKAQSVT